MTRGRFLPREDERCILELMRRVHGILPRALKRTRKKIEMVPTRVRLKAVFARESLVAGSEPTESHKICVLGAVQIVFFVGLCN